MYPNFDSRRKSALCSKLGKLCYITHVDQDSYKGLLENLRLGAFQSKTQYRDAGSRLTLFGGFQRVADAYVDGIDHGDAGGEFAEVGAADEIGDEGVDGKRAQ